MPATEAAAGTRQRILDAALRLFAEHGFGETSLRAITQEAGVNLAAVNYHFGHKEDLVGEVFARLIRPVNEERLALLDRLEAERPGRPVPLEPLVEVFIGPALRTFKLWGPTPMRFMARVYAESNEHVQRIFVEQLREVVQRFTAAFRRTLPDLAEREVVWRLMFAVGSMIHTIIGQDKLEDLRPDLAAPADAEDHIQRLTAFICGGMRAPAPSAATGRGRRGRKRTGA